VDKRRLNILDFPRNILSIDIIEQLKSPEFDVWGWDSNEMLCLSEYMFTILGITKEFNMDILIFQTWLVRATSVEDITELITKTMFSSCYKTRLG